MAPWLCVAAGGALGALSRFSIGNLPYVTANPHLKTLLINVIGCMLIGISWAVFETWQVSRLWYNFVIAGFLGGFTTYSSFSLETMRLLSDGRVIESMVYVMLTVIGCLTACAIGLFATKYFIN